MMLSSDPHEIKLKRIRDEVEQLKREVGNERQKVSSCARELVSFCESELKKDPLLHKVLLSDNPFKPKGGRCRIS
eukprot:Seg5815.2 transcript_id=Seg5815.2/GoldUCD/mRNA.D3Y31 product="hypothetical protein" protein_id=Seg5815.2/GoldUCD/D3Y31